MRVAFYAPMKPVDHPVPSGERTIARLFCAALAGAGHEPWQASRFVSRDGAGDGRRQARLHTLANRLAARLSRRLLAAPAPARPRAWLTYHLYHKAPDWLGPPVAASLNIPYLVAEASFAPKQAGGPWDIGHRAVADALAHARAVICLNPEDAPCVQARLSPKTQLYHLPPFIDTAYWRKNAADRMDARARFAQTHAMRTDNCWLLAVAMMRAGDKETSFDLLARTLSLLPAHGWSLLIAGDGPRADAIAARLAAASPGQVYFLGRLTADQLASLYGCADLLVWPAWREAIGMAVLEAQAAGLPVVAGARPGLAALIAPGSTGLITPIGDAAAMAGAVTALINDAARRRTMGRAAATYARARHDITGAGKRIDRILRTVTGEG